jgi:hypothetical protein
MVNKTIFTIIVSKRSNSFELYEIFVNKLYFISLAVFSIKTNELNSFILNTRKKTRICVVS